MGHGVRIYLVWTLHFSSILNQNQHTVPYKKFRGIQTVESIVLTPQNFLYASVYVFMNLNKTIRLIILKLQFFKEGEVSAGNHSIKIRLWETGVRFYSIFWQIVVMYSQELIHWWILFTLHQVFLVTNTNNITLLSRFTHH